MASIKVYNWDKKEVGSVELPENIFNAKINTALVHQVVVAQLAGRRRGTASTKTKAEVRGGGKKPFKQKGTGRARQGSSRSPLMPGGGQSFGPKPRSYEQKVNKRMAMGAMCAVLSDKFKAEKLIVLDKMDLSEVKTKAIAGYVKNFDLKKALFVDHENRNLELSMRNLPKFKCLRTEGLNVYDTVNHEWLVLSKRALETVNEKLAANKVAASEAK